MAFLIILPSWICSVKYFVEAECYCIFSGYVTGAVGTGKPCRQEWATCSTANSVDILDFRSATRVWEWIDIAAFNPNPSYLQLVGS